MLSNSRTTKLLGWEPQAPPVEDENMRFHRQLLTEIVFSLWHKKKKILEKKGWPPQPVTLKQIWLEYQSRRQLLIDLEEWPRYACCEYEKRTIDRRVNEIAEAKFAEDGKTPRIVAATAGLYQPNPELFRAKI